MTKNMLNPIFIRCTLLGLALLLQACASAPERNPLPIELTNEAVVAGAETGRFWGDEWPKWSRDRFQSLSEQELEKSYGGVYRKPHAYLAISGGGANGAFGAGLLVGWTATGTRPEFTMVTGVSTGALSAPFAFLGSAYDDKLKEVYTTVSTKDVAAKRSLLSAAFSDSMADTEPLKALIAKYIDAPVLEAIAQAHSTGRRLFIGTVNLDAGRSVIWNIGAIASSGHPRRLQLVQDVLRASAAIPVAFPPVLIEVEAGGKTYDEMHVDGGTGSQVFVYPAAIDWRQITKMLKVPSEPKVYVIRNSFLDPDYQGVKRTLLPIASRSIDSLIRTQGVGDLYQIHALCERDGNDFNLAYIPATFIEEPTEGFDPVYMTKLYDLGFQMAKADYPWEKVPPGFGFKK